MRIGLHGGNCCGIKSISGLGYYPAERMAARKSIKMTSFGQHWSSGSNDMIHYNPRGKCDFFNLAAPKETYEERFKRFVSFIKEHRSHHLIEVTTNIFQRKWYPILEELGFKVVTKFNNSNTGSTIIVHHLVY